MVVKRDETGVSVRNLEDSDGYGYNATASALPFSRFVVGAASSGAAAEAIRDPGHRDDCLSLGRNRVAIDGTYGGAFLEGFNDRLQYLSHTSLSFGMCQGDGTGLQRRISQLRFAKDAKPSTDFPSGCSSGGFHRHDCPGQRGGTSGRKALSRSCLGKMERASSTNSQRYSWRKKIPPCRNPVTSVLNPGRPSRINNLGPRASRTSYNHRLLWDWETNSQGT